MSGSLPSGVGGTTTSFTPTPTASPVGAGLPLRTQYALSARMTQGGRHLAVSQEVTYVNRSPEPLAELLFVVEPNRHPGAFHLKSVRWGDGKPVEALTLQDARLLLPLPNVLYPGETITLSLSFELDLPARAGPFGATARQTNLGDWYPFVPPYRPCQRVAFGPSGERGCRPGTGGWLAHEPAVIGEHLVYDVADYRVDIQLAGNTAGWIIAASAPATIEAGWQRYRLDAARNFAWSVSPEYHVLSERVGSTTILAYVFPEHLTAGRAALETTAAALALYSELFSAYPHASLTLVEAHFADGREYDGLYFLDHAMYASYPGTPQSYLAAIAAHETAHQWWYGLVGNDQALEPWLDEALATYSELLLYEARYPELVDWWWEFRVRRFNPTGRVDSTIYDHGGFRPYVDAVYLRGALFLEALRRLVGDEALFAFLQHYAKQHTHRQATAEDFFALLTEHSPTAVGELVQAYFVAEE